MNKKTGKEIMEMVHGATDEQLKDIALNSPAFLQIAVERNTLEIEKLLIEIKRWNLELAFAVSQWQAK